MKFLYCDESGTGDQPIAVMVGVLVDATRMHITKIDWCALLAKLSELAGREITELHTRNFYAGNGPWRNLNGPQRASIISAVMDWFCERKHKIVFSSAHRAGYSHDFDLQKIPDELNTLWRFLGFHLVLSLQKYCQGLAGIKGNTVLIFDNEHREQMRFTDILMRPAEWSSQYYGKKKKQEPLDQIVDVPYFGDSQEVSLIQLADFLAFFLRRYAEIKTGASPARYVEEEQKIDDWVNTLMSCSVGRNFMYIRNNRNYAEDIFFRNAPECLRNLGQ